MTAGRTAALLRDGRDNLRGELLPGMPGTLTPRAERQ